MPEARCPKCGYHCYGWALANPEQQTCPECGTKLEIYQEKGGREGPASGFGERQVCRQKMLK